MSREAIGFFGAGNMAEAILDGIIAEGVVRPEDIYVTNRSNDEKLQLFKQKYGINITRDYSEITSNCKYLLISVKPKDVAGLLAALKDLITAGHVIISVAAGITTEYIERSMGKDVPVIRVMPNTSCRVKEGATGIAFGKYAGEVVADFAKRIFASIGKVVAVKEDMLDAVTGLSGSGPAYVYLMMEAMIQAGMKQGLSRELSEELTYQTVYGAAKMVRCTRESPDRLIRQIATPGGTTMAGLQALERANIAGAFMEAVERATQRSREMTREYCNRREDQ